MPRHSKTAKLEAMRLLVADAARNNGAPNFVDVARYCEVSDRPLRRWWEDQEALNVHSLPPTSESTQKSTHVPLAEAVQTRELSDIWLTILLEADLDIAEARAHGSMGSVPSLRKLQVDLVTRYKAAAKEEGATRPQTPEEVEAKIRTSARMLSPRMAGALVEELKKRNLA